MPNPLHKTVRWGIVTLVAGLCCQPAHALMRWNEGKDQLHITATAAWMYDSNIYTNADEIADDIIRGSLRAEYRRHAGLIGINADIGVSIADFSENVDESFQNPNLRVEFNKDTGRTTGTLGFSVFRASRADPAANMRTDSWNYSSELRLKYPINERHNLSAGLDWRRQDYTDNSFLVDIDTTTIAADWFYIFTPERDLFGGYRLRFSETSAGSRYADHSLSAGVAGRLIRGLNGSARVGFQTRSDLNNSGEDYTGYNASISSTWNFTRAIALTAFVTKDFNVTSTNISTDALSGNLDLQYARSAKLVLSAGVGAGITKFLGDAGGNREDTFMSAYARVQYTFSEKLRVALTYSYFRNWSNQSFSDFARDSITFDATSRF